MHVYHTPTKLLVVSDVPVSGDKDAVEITLADGSQLISATADLEIHEELSDINLYAINSAGMETKFVSSGEHFEDNVAAIRKIMLSYCKETSSVLLVKGYYSEYPSVQPY